MEQNRVGFGCRDVCVRGKMEEWAELAEGKRQRCDCAWVCEMA